MSMSQSWFEEVLPSKFGQPVKLVNLFAVLTPARLCSTILDVAETRLINKKYPHLKRVKALNEDTANFLILVSEKNVTPPSLLSMPSLEGSCSLVRVSVPKDEPLTRAQAEDCSKYWPTSYRQPGFKPIAFEKIRSADYEINISNFSNVRDVIAKFMVMVNDKPLTCAGRDRLLCASRCVLALGGTPVGMGSSAEIMPTQSNFFGHAILVALSDLSASVLKLQRSEKDPLLLAKHPDNRDRQGRRRTELNGCSESLLMIRKEYSSSEFNKTKSMARNDIIADKYFCLSRPLESSQYYAKDAIAFCSAEPCLMCAMALLHSRVFAVVFPTSCINTEFGGLGGRWSLHVDSRLNHKFRVIRVDLERLRSN